MMLILGRSGSTECVGIPLGTTCVDVFSHLKTVRASYKGLKPYDADGVEWDRFAEQYVPDAMLSFCLGQSFTSSLLC